VSKSLQIQLETASPMAVLGGAYQVGDFVSTLIGLNGQESALAPY